MSIIKAKDFMTMIVDEANQRFAPLMKANPDGEAGINRLAELADIMIKEFHASEFEFEIEDDTTDILLTIFAPDAIIQSADNEPTSQVLLLFQAAKTVIVKQSDDKAGIALTFRFPGIWERAV